MPLLLRHTPLKAPLLSSSLIDERAAIAYKLISYRPFELVSKILYRNNHFFIALPRRRIFLRDRRIVVQFHLRFLNWCWHSLVPTWTPFAISFNKDGSFRQMSASFPFNLLVFLQTSIGSITIWLPTVLKARKKLFSTSYSIDRRRIVPRRYAPSLLRRKNEHRLFTVW